MHTKYTLAVVKLCYTIVPRQIATPTFANKCIITTLRIVKKIIRE